MTANVLASLANSYWVGGLMSITMGNGHGQRQDRTCTNNHEYIHTCIINQTCVYIYIQANITYNCTFRTIADALRTLNNMWNIEDTKPTLNMEQTKRDENGSAAQNGLQGQKKHQSQGTQPSRKSVSVQQLQAAPVAAALPSVDSHHSHKSLSGSRQRCEHR